MHGLMTGSLDLASGAYHMAKGYFIKEVEGEIKHKGGGETWWLIFLFIVCAFLLGIICYTWFWKKLLCWTIFFLSLFCIVCIVYIVFLTSHNKNTRLD